MGDSQGLSAEIAGSFQIRGWLSLRGACRSPPGPPQSSPEPQGLAPGRDEVGRVPHAWHSGLGHTCWRVRKPCIRTAVLRPQLQSRSPVGHSSIHQVFLLVHFAGTHRAWKLAGIPSVFSEWVRVHPSLCWAIQILLDLVVLTCRG